MLVLADVGVRVGTLDILAGVNLAVGAGRCVGITGPSGSGKTTLLHAAGLLLRPTSGHVTWEGAVPANPSLWRRRGVGFVFQDFCLVPELSALDNVLLPIGFERFRVGAARVQAIALLGRIGIATPHRRAGLLSRGEQQRVAIARATLGHPRLILADEPTASLDAATGAEVAARLVETVRATGAALLVVSHDLALLGRLDEVHRLDAGRLT